MAVPKDLYIGRLLVGDSLHIYGRTLAQVKKAADGLNARLKAPRQFRITKERNAEGIGFVYVQRLDGTGGTDNPLVEPVRRVVWLDAEAAKGPPLGKLLIGDSMRVYGASEAAVEASIGALNDRLRQRGELQRRFILAKSHNSAGQEYWEALRVNLDGKPPALMRAARVYEHRA